jgi:Spy/CpxP family protein refolding chaperone
MKHRITLVLIIGLLLCMGIMQAAAQRPPMMTPEERTKQLTDSLGLTKEQQPKVLKIFQDADKKRQELFNSNSGDRDAMRSAMREAMDKTNKEIATLLTAKQKATFEAMNARRMQRWQNRQGPPQGDNPPPPPPGQ